MTCNVQALSVRHQSYHTDLKLAAYAGILPDNVAKQIPKSTRSTWKKLDPQQFFGKEYSTFLTNMDFLKEIADCRTAIKVGHAIARLAYTLRSLNIPFSQIRKVKSPELRAKIVSVINRVQQNVGLNRCLRFIGITRQRFSDWSQSSTACLSSPWGLCRKKKPNQLTISEVRKIKQAYLDQDHFHWPISAIAWQLIIPVENCHSFRS